MCQNASDWHRSQCFAWREVDEPHQRERVLGMWLALEHSDGTRVSRYGRRFEGWNELPGGASSLWLLSAMMCVMHHVRDAGFHIIYPHLVRHSCRFSRAALFIQFLFVSLIWLTSIMLIHICLLDSGGVKMSVWGGAYRAYRCLSVTKYIIWSKYKHPAAHLDWISEVRAVAQWAQLSAVCHLFIESQGWGPIFVSYAILMFDVRYQSKRELWELFRSKFFPLCSSFLRRTVSLQKFSSSCHQSQFEPVWTYTERIEPWTKPTLRRENQNQTEPEP